MVEDSVGEVSLERTAAGDAEELSLEFRGVQLFTTGGCWTVDVANRVRGGTSCRSTVLISLYHYQSTVPLALGQDAQFRTNPHSWFEDFPSCILLRSVVALSDQPQATSHMRNAIPLE